MSVDVPVFLRLLSVVECFSCRICYILILANAMNSACLFKNKNTICKEIKRSQNKNRINKQKEFFVYGIANLCSCAEADKEKHF